MNSTEKHLKTQRNASVLVIDDDPDQPGLNPTPALTFSPSGSSADVRKSSTGGVNSCVVSSTDNQPARFRTAKAYGGNTVRFLDVC